jgi:hypothetical protein
MPMHVQINALELKLNEIEGRHAGREAALRGLEQEAAQRTCQSTLKYEVFLSTSYFSHRSLFIRKRPFFWKFHIFLQ